MRACDVLRLVLTAIFLTYYLLALACLHFLDFAPSGVVGTATSSEPEAAKVSQIEWPIGSMHSRNLGDGSE